MAWEQHITRRYDWSDEGDDISLEEWRSYVESSSDLRPEGFYPIDTTSDEALRTAPLDVFRSVTFFENLINGGYYQFDHYKGVISVTHPDDVVFRRMYQIAQHFGGTLQDDDGEPYDENGKIQPR